MGVRPQNGNGYEELRASAVITTGGQQLPDRYISLNPQGHLLWLSLRVLIARPGLDIAKDEPVLENRL